jgi:hypothetical protein
MAAGGQEPIPGRDYMPVLTTHRLQIRIVSIRPGSGEDSYGWSRTSALGVGDMIDISGEGAACDDVMLAAGEDE